MIRKILDWLRGPSRHEVEFNKAAKEVEHEIIDLTRRHKALQASYATLNRLLDKQQETITFLEKARDDAHEQCEIKHKAWKYAEDRAAILEGKLGYIKDIIDNGPLYTELTEIDTPPPPKDSLVEAIENSVADMPDDLSFNDYFNEIFVKQKPFKLPTVQHLPDEPLTQEQYEEVYRAAFGLPPYFDRAGAIRELVSKGYTKECLDGMPDVWHSLLSDTICHP